MKVVRTVKTKRFTYSDVIPETKEEEEDIKRIIREVQEEDKLPFDPSKWTLVKSGSRRKLK